jgi:glutathione S-transferase
MLRPDEPAERALEEAMKLYNANLSPFASRCRLQIYAKGIDVPVVDPPAALGTPEYKRVNPTGKVPALDLDGRVIPESSVILEYLEERFPQKPLLPRDPAERARARLLARFGDVYLAQPMSALFGQLNPQTRNAAVVETELGNLAKAFDYLEAYIDGGPYAVGGALTLADCTLVPGFFFITRLLPMLGRANPLEKHPKLAAWWQAVQKDPSAARVLGEMSEAMAARFGGAR